MLATVAKRKSQAKFQQKNNAQRRKSARPEPEPAAVKVATTTRPPNLTPCTPTREVDVASATTPERLGATNQSQGPPLKFLSRDEVLQLINVSYPTLWSWIRAGTFPPARELSGNTRASRIYWLEHEVLTWMANRPPRLPRGTVAIYNNNPATEAR